MRPWTTSCLSANPAARAAMAARFGEAIRRDLWRPRRNSVASNLAEASHERRASDQRLVPDAALDPMPSGDGWLARIKPSAATLTADAARLVARLAARHGNGLIDLTSRANLQMRGLTPASAALLADEVIASGLAAADPAREAIRNVMANPLGPDDRIRRLRRA